MVNEHDDIIEQSHLRSKQFGVIQNRLYSKTNFEGTDLQQILIRNKALIETVKPHISELYTFLKGSGYLIALTDRDGVLLLIYGDDEVVAEAKKIKITIGSQMSEDNVGTNAMGTAISEDAPVQITASEHFISAYQTLTCSAAPIHDFRGQLLGTLNLTGKSEDVHPHTLGLVVSAVKAIESEMRTETIHQRIEEAYDYVYAVMNTISSGIISTDLTGNIKRMNEAASKMLQCPKELLIQKDISDLIPDWKNMRDKIISGQMGRDVELLIKVNGKPEKFNVNAYPLKKNDQELYGLLVTFKEIGAIFNLVNKYTGMHAHYTFDDIIGRSKEIRWVKEYARSISDSPSTILITGESGTGKEVLAQAIHNASNRVNNGFVAINCGAIPPTLIESELFGYDEGAFTGARKGGKAGKFELANKGTLFLDEIGEMPVDMQVRILRVLQEGVITRVGGNKVIPVDVRIIAATNKNLKEEIEKGNFRLDLFYRLSVIPIVLPPLRERPEDVEDLISFFLVHKAKKLNRVPISLPPDMIKSMKEYEWPGNIRELENFVEKAVNLNGKLRFDEHISDMSIHAQPIVIQHEIAEDTPRIAKNRVVTLEDLEKQAIAEAIQLCEKNMSKVAKSLGISRNTLYLKVKKYDIPIE